MQVPALIMQAPGFDLAGAGPGISRRQALFFPPPGFDFAAAMDEAGKKTAAGGAGL